MQNPPRLKIETYLQQAQNYARQANWQQTITVCQQVIKHCQLQLNTPQPATAATYLRVGDRLLAAGQTEDAIASYAQALQLQPNSCQINQKLAEALGQAGKWAEATAYYRQAIELDQTKTPSTEKTHRARGDLFRSQGKIEAAISEYNLAVKVQPNSAELWANLGSLYAQQQQWQQAISSYQRALKIKPNFAGVCRNLARVFKRVGKQQLASDYLYRALTLEPNRSSAEDCLELGDILSARQKSEPAIDCYLRAIKLRSDLTEAYIGLAKVLTDLKQIDRALNLARQLINQNPEQAAPYIYQGSILRIQQKWTEAIAAYQQAIKIQPQLWQAYQYLAEIKFQQEKWAEAAAAFRHAISIKPDLSWLHHNLGYTTFKLEQWSESETAFRDALKLNPKFPWSYVGLGETLVKVHQWQPAIAAFLSAIELERDLPGVHKLLGIALRQLVNSTGNLEAAIVNIRQLIPLQLHHITAPFYCQLAAQLTAQKQYIGAIVFYRLALQLQPNDLQITSQLQQVQQQQQQLELKIFDCRQKIKQKPNQAWIYCELGNILSDMGEYEQAIALHRQASVLRGWHLALESRKYQFQYDWFTHNIPIWQKHFQDLAHTPITMLEIGSYEGMATCWLLDYILTHPQSQITCIDLYFQHNFERNIAQTQAKQKVIKLAGNSHHILPTLAPHHYDIIYIDGSHLADDVKQDANLSWGLLKVGGIVIFDDYQLKTPGNPEQDTKIGIDAFLQAIAGCYQTLHLDYQLLIKKIA